MIYYVLRFYARLGMWINFRKVYREHRERIPAHGHLIFALNHPTAFLEPIAVGSHEPRSCWYVLRGDKFEYPAVRWFLGQIQNVPIYRESDGVHALRGNASTMAKLTDEVVRGEPTVILCEGVWNPQRRLHPVQRGTARMLFQAWRKAKDVPVAIVPVGVTYTDANAFRSTVTLTFGEPIHAADYAVAFRADARATIDEVTELLDTRLRDLIVNVPDEADDALVERLLPLIQHAHPDPAYPPAADDSPFHDAQRAAAARAAAMDRVARNALVYDLDAYDAALAQADASDGGVALPGYATPGRALALWASSPLAVLGFLLHYPLATLVQRWTERNIESAQFIASARYGVGLLAYFLYVLALTVLVALLLGWFAVLVPPAMLALGYFYLLWSESLELWRQASRAKNLDPMVREKLTRLRAATLENVGLSA